MEFEFITVATADHVTRITLDRPEVMNAINKPMHAEMQFALDAFAVDADQYICVITGRGNIVFCSCGNACSCQPEKSQCNPFEDVFKSNSHHFEFLLSQAATF